LEEKSEGIPVAYDVPERQGMVRAKITSLPPDRYGPEKCLSNLFSGRRTHSGHRSKIQTFV